MYRLLINSIQQIQLYMLSLNVLPVFKARGIDNPYYFLVKLGLSPYTVNNILYNGVHSLDLRHVELLCKALVCEPNDLLVWNPDKNQFYPDNLPLQKLKAKPLPIDVQQTLFAIPYKELVDIGNQLKSFQKQETNTTTEVKSELEV